MFLGFCLLFTLGIFISVFFSKNIYLSTVKAPNFDSDS
jgi:hypothetical protein